MTEMVAAGREGLVAALFPRDGLVVEVGVQRGWFSRKILNSCGPKMLFLVDCWRQMGGLYGELDPEAKTADHVQDAWRMDVVVNLATRRNVSVMCLLSSEAAELFADGSLDAVYLDADHTAPGIAGDLRLWWPKVRPGGIFCGHDYCTTPWIAVKEHVDHFVSVYKLDLMVSGEPDYPSWAVRKPL